LAALARGTNIPNLTRTALATLELPVPPLAEQAVIANLADTLANEERLTHDLFNARRRELSLRVFGSVRREKTHFVADE
jgi:restriction endonuclease S subunit